MGPKPPSPQATVRDPPSPAIHDAGFSRAIPGLPTTAPALNATLLRHPFSSPIPIPQSYTRSLLHCRLHLRTSSFGQRIAVEVVADSRSRQILDAPALNWTRPFSPASLFGLNPTAFPTAWVGCLQIHSIHHSRAGTKEGKKDGKKYRQRSWDSKESEID
ncbi:hypothetical protein DTO207G8_4415 [Paecilomyces variotii]|nr:hypothetical protein DTO207G8_4415 [Paecilomyces variotii]